MRPHDRNGREQVTASAEVRRSVRRDQPRRPRIGGRRAMVNIRTGLMGPVGLRRPRNDGRTQPGVHNQTVQSAARRPWFLGSRRTPAWQRARPAYPGITSGRCPPGVCTSPCVAGTSVPAGRHRPFRRPVMWDRRRLAARTHTCRMVLPAKPLRPARCCAPSSTNVTASTGRHPGACYEKAQMRRELRPNVTAATDPRQPPCTNRVDFRQWVTDGTVLKAPSDHSPDENTKYTVIRHRTDRTRP